MTEHVKNISEQEKGRLPSSQPKSATDGNDTIAHKV